MKTVILFVIILGYSHAQPSLDWSKIRSNNAYVQPIANVSHGLLPRIVGGSEAVPNSRPYQAAIIIDGRLFCGGSLISRNFVLTSAHCLEGYAYFQIILGAHNIRETEPTQIVVTSTNIIVHQDYNHLNLNNDVGLIRFPSPINLNSHIQTITLAPSNSGSFEDALAILSGWGRLSDSSTGLASTLNEIQLTVMSSYWCYRSYGGQIVINSTLCTSGVDSSASIGGCDGDSGGPLVFEGVQIGVVSFTAASGCESGLPTGYARITSFRSWIAQNSDLY